MLKFNLLFCIGFCIQLSSLSGDLIFTSPTKIKLLFSTVNGVIETLEKYIAYEEDHINTVEKQLNEWKQEHDHNAKNPEENFADHISLFNFLKKLQTWSTYMKDTAKENSASRFLSDLKNTTNYTWPVEEDMTGVMDSIINLQQVYDMEADTIAKGVFRGVSTNSSLCFEECFMMSERCFETVHYEYALQWSTEALEKYFNEHINDEERLSKILYIISYCAYVKGQYDKAMESVTIYMQSNPDDRKGKALRDRLLLKLPAGHEKSISKEMEIWNNYKKLCGKYTTEAEMSKHPELKCRYNNDNYFLRIAPLKEEILSLNPKLILFRDVIYDSEVEFLKKESKHRFQQIFGDEESNIQYESTHVAYFMDREFDEISKLTERIQDMTALRVNRRRQFQLFKYDVGGSFLDYKTESVKNSKNNKALRTRATTLFHLNDVIRGGSTVFPDLNIAIKAEKGTALVWFKEIKNQFSSCAPIVGHKWILTRFI